MTDPFENVLPPGRGRGPREPPAPDDALTAARRAAAEPTASAVGMGRQARMDACDHTVGAFWRDRGFELDDGAYLHHFDGEVVGELRGIRLTGASGEPLAQLWLNYGHGWQEPEDHWPFARLWRPLPEL